MSSKAQKSRDLKTRFHRSQIPESAYGQKEPSWDLTISGRDAVFSVVLTSEEVQDLLSTLNQFDFADNNRGISLD